MALRSNKKALSPVLTIGLVTAMAVLLLGGLGISQKLAEDTARASPLFIATSLISLINTADAAPESLSFEYFTEQDANGFPVIGSLEINDDTRELCIHKKTEDEMMSNIVEQTTIAADFGGAGYTYDKVRSLIAKKRAQKAVTESILQEQLSQKIIGKVKIKGIEDKVAKKLAEDSYDGQLYRKFFSKSLAIDNVGEFIGTEAGPSDDILRRVFDSEQEIKDFQKIMNIESVTDPQFRANLARANGALGIEERAFIKNINPVKLVEKTGIKLSEKLGAKLAAKLAERTYEGKLIRTFLGSEAFEGKLALKNEDALLNIFGNKKDMKMFQQLVEKESKSNSRFWQELVKKQKNLAPGEKKVINEINTIKVSFWSKYRLKLSQWWGRRTISKYTARITGAFAKVGKWTGIKWVRDKWTKIPARVRGGIVGAAFIGGIAAAQYYLSGGDATQTILTTLQFTLMAYIPKWVEKYVAKKFSRYLTESLPFRMLTNTALERGKAAAAAVQPPIVGIPACYVVHAASVAVNVIWSFIDMAIFDLAMYKTYAAASSTAGKEREGLVCKNFKSSSEVLLSPPNCNPVAKLSPNLEKWKPMYLTALWSSAAMFTASTVYASATSVFTCKDLGIKENVDAGTLVLLAGGAAEAALGLGGIVSELAKNPGDIIPKAECDASCDKEYLRQDCPNWYISKSRDAGEWAQTGGIVALLNGGPACYWLGLLTGWGAQTCNMARYMTAFALVFSAPDAFFHFMLNGDAVGLTKTIGTKSALGMDNEFANNEGYWYAEWPYAIEITKIYTDAGESKLVIRKS